MFEYCIHYRHLCNVQCIRAQILVFACLYLGPIGTSPLALYWSCIPYHVHRPSVFAKYVIFIFIQWSSHTATLQLPLLTNILKIVVDRQHLGDRFLPENSIATFVDNTVIIAEDNTIEDWLPRTLTVGLKVCE